MPYTPAADWVDLYYDGVYRGTYLVSETNAVGSTGVDITGMETAYAAVNADYGSDMTTAAAENRYGRTYRYTAGLTEPADITGGKNAGMKTIWYHHTHRPVPERCEADQIVESLSELKNLL